MSDYSVSPRENQRQLDDLKQEQELKLQKIRGEYQKKQVAERTSGEAAISHIRKNTEERAEQLRNEGHDKLAREGEVLNRDYKDLKRNAAQKIESAEEKMTREQERAKRNIEAVKKDEYKTLERSQSQLQEFLESQRELRAQARSVASEDIEKTRTRTSEQITQAKRQASERVRKVENDNQAAIGRIKSENDVLYNETKDQARNRLLDLNRQEVGKLESERKERNRAITEMQRKYKDAIEGEEATGQHQITDLKKNNDAKFQQTRDHGVLLNESMQKKFASESQRIQTTGEQDIQLRQSSFEDLRKRQEIQNNEQLENDKAEHLARETRARKESEARLQFETQKLDQEIKNQRSEFKSRFSADGAVFKDSMNNQKETYLKALYKQKQKFDERFGTEAARSEDPFYRLKSFDARLDDQPDAFVLKAKVAPHEKNSVDLIVKDDKLVLSAKRAYQDGFEDGAGGRTSTSSYQTFRQEFKLDTPIEPKKAIRRVEADGSILVIAPKKGRV